MRRALEPRVRRWWRGGAGAGGRILHALALPAELLYRGGVAVRNAAFDRGLLRAHGVRVPVVSVGNLVVGGTGKTPVAGWLVGELTGAGHTPALVARGYANDELRLHRRWHPGGLLHADPDRVRAARSARSAGADVLVLDDGFQHRRLRRDLDLVLLAAETRFPGRALPRGPYREPAGALRRAHAVLVTRRTAGEDEAAALAERVRHRAPHVRVGVVTLAPAGWTDLSGQPASAPSGELLAACSVAAPEDFLRMVEAVGGSTPRGRAFPDHHDYSVSDVAALAREAAGATLVTTEKDAVKLERFADRLPATRVLTLAVRPGPGAAEVLADILRVAAGSAAPPAASLPGTA